MSTRGLVEVKKNGKLCCAQYNRCDSYPSYCGKQLAEFFCEKKQVSKLVKGLDKCKFVLADDTDLESGRYENDRDILDYIANSDKETIELSDYSEFAEDTLFCEYAWVIDIKTEGEEIKSIELRVFAYGKRIGVFDALNDDLTKVDWSDLEHDGVY